MMTTIMVSEVTSVSRRTLLLGGAATMLGACAPASSATTPAPTHSSVVHHLTVAHRGGGANWPEMTLYAYQQAVKLPGLKALEVSVQRAGDGTLVCSHDTDTGRLGTKALVIADSTWRELSEVEVKPTETDDRDQPSRPLARLEEVLEWWPTNQQLWIEPKADDAVEPLAKLLARRTDLDIVWKRPVNADFTVARTNGWGGFGYVLAGDQQLEYLYRVTAGSPITHLGVQKTQDDARVVEVAHAAHMIGKQAMMWALNTTAERDRALKLGMDALMCSNIRGLVNS